MEKFYIRGLNGKLNLEYDVDSQKIKLGQILYVKEEDGIYTKKEIQQSEKEEFVQNLDKLKLYLAGIMDGESIEKYINNFIEQFELKYYYKTSYKSKNPLHKVKIILQKISLIEEVRQNLVDNYSVFHLVSYLYLTCFDALGQENGYLEFVDWLDRNYEIEKYSIEDLKLKYSRYKEDFGVRKSFFRGINEIIPVEQKEQLLKSFEFNKIFLKNPEKNINNDPLEKIYFLYQMRNDFTHGSNLIGGNMTALNPDLINIDILPEKIFTVNFTKKEEHYFEQFMGSSVFIENLNDCVKYGLASFMEKSYK